MRTQVSSPSHSGSSDVASLIRSGRITLRGTAPAVGNTRTAMSPPQQHEPVSAPAPGQPMPNGWIAPVADEPSACSAANWVGVELVIVGSTDQPAKSIVLFAMQWALVVIVLLDDNHPVHRAPPFMIRTTCGCAPLSAAQSSPSRYTLLSSLDVFGPVAHAHTRPKAAI